MTHAVKASDGAAALRQYAAAVQKLRSVVGGAGGVGNGSMLDAQSALRTVDIKRSAAGRALSEVADDLGRTSRTAVMETAMNRALYASLLVRGGVLTPEELEKEAAWLVATFPAPTAPQPDVAP